MSGHCLCFLSVQSFVNRIRVPLYLPCHDSLSLVFINVVQADGKLLVSAPVYFDVYPGRRNVMTLFLNTHVRLR